MRVVRRFTMLVAAMFALAGVASLPASAASAGPGARDLSFNGTGIVDVWGIPTNYFVTVAQAAVVQPDHKIVVVGTAMDPTTFGDDFGVVRLNADGSFDSSFGSGGHVTIPFSGASEAYAVTLQSDGSLYVGGSVGGGTNTGVAKLTSTGHLDGTFGSGGKATIPYPYADASGQTGTSNGMTVSQGRPVVLVQVSKHDALAALTTTGATDTTWGTGGIATIVRTSGDPGQWTAVAAAPGGGVLVGGWGLPASGLGNHMELARFNALGQSDASFGTNGYLVLYVGNEQPGKIGIASFGDVGVEPDGSILVWGFDENSSPGVIPYTGVGPLLIHLDGVGGIVSQSGVLGQDGSAPIAPMRLALAPDGSVYALEEHYDSATSEYSNDVLRFTSGLAFDSAFGNGGLASANFGADLPPGGADQAKGLAVDLSGNPLVVGIHQDPSTKPRGAIMRLLGASGATPALNIIGLPKTMTVSGSTLPITVSATTSGALDVVGYTVHSYADRANASRARVKIGHAHVTLTAGHKQLVKLHLSNPAKALLAKLHTLRVRLTLTLTSHGNHAVKTATLNLKAATKHKHP